MKILLHWPFIPKPGTLIAWLYFVYLLIHQQQCCLVWLDRNECHQPLCFHMPSGHPGKQWGSKLLEWLVSPASLPSPEPHLCCLRFTPSWALQVMKGNWLEININCNSNSFSLSARRALASTMCAKPAGVAKRGWNPRAAGANRTSPTRRTSSSAFCCSATRSSTSTWPGRPFFASCRRWRPTAGRPASWKSSTRVQASKTNSAARPASPNPPSNSCPASSCPPWRPTCRRRLSSPPQASRSFRRRNPLRPTLASRRPFRPLHQCLPKRSRSRCPSAVRSKPPPPPPKKSRWKHLLTGVFSYY